MVVFEKDGAVEVKGRPRKTPTWEEHYNDAHGAWCNQLNAQGSLKDDHLPCAYRWATEHNEAPKVPGTRRPNTRVGISRQRRPK